MAGASVSGRRPGSGSASCRRWTVDEANARLAGLRELLSRLRGWAHRRGEVRAELDRLARFWGEELDALDQPDHGLTLRLEAERRNLARRLEDALAALRAEGIEVRQLESGLVDFYALLDDEPVLLCWRADEAEVAHYHLPEGGFAGRRRLPTASRGFPGPTG